MRHLKAGKKLNMSGSHRKALKKNLAVGLLRHERLTTTLAKAKFIHKEIDKYVTLAKRGDLHARRQAFAALRDKEIVTRLFTEYKERYANRDGGYSRVIKLSKPRRGDAAEMAVVEMVDSVKFSQEKEVKKKKSKSKVKENIKTEASVTSEEVVDESAVEEKTDSTETSVENDSDASEKK